MSMMVSELYAALKAAGVTDEIARDAARAVIGAEQRSDLATKADLAELKAELIKWNVGTVLTMTAVFAAIVKLL